jgi:hypothetical protein
MKKIKITLMIVFAFFACITMVNAKSTLITCEYNNTRTAASTKTTKRAGAGTYAAVCKIYNDYSHQCYFSSGTSASKTDTSIKIKNWSSKFSYDVTSGGETRWEDPVKNYVMNNNKCPDYLVLTSKKKTFGGYKYEIHAFSTETYAEGFREEETSNDSKKTGYVLDNTNTTYAETTSTTTTTTTGEETNSSTDLEITDICNQTGVKKSFRFLGYLLFVAKILVPIILIIMGSIDFGKAVVAGNSDALKKSSQKFVTRIIAGVVVFIIPTIVYFVFGLLPATSNNYSACYTCFFKPRDCTVSSTSSTSTAKSCSDYSASNCPATAENGKSCKVIYDSWDTSHEYGACSTKN